MLSTHLKCYWYIWRKTCLSSLSFSPVAINCSDVATGRQMVGFILVWDFAKEYCGWKTWWMKTGTDQLKAFCKEVIITIYHWTLMGSDGKEKMGRKIDGRNLWNDASGIYFNNWIRWRLMGENRPFHLYYFKCDTLPCNTLPDYGNIQNVTMGERWAAGKTH